MNQPPFDRVLEDIKSHGLRVMYQDLERPWGGFYSIEEAQIELFASIYFPHMQLPRPEDRLAMRPKILMVAPGKRLSWQYHNRRAEEWRILEGPVAIESSMTDEEPAPINFETNATFRAATTQRHRLIGLDNWGVVAEIWVHTDRTNPSHEDDIVRVQDDFARETPKENDGKLAVDL
jgi:mannose-6-phosphate isomerase